MSIRRCPLKMELEIPMSGTIREYSLVVRGDVVLAQHIRTTTPDGTVKLETIVTESGLR